MSRWNLAWLLGLCSAAALGLSLTYSAPTLDSNIQKKHENLKLVVDVLEEVQRNYVKELDQDKMRELVENMVNGGLESLDPHSNFINAEEFKQFNKLSKGKFGGIGIRIEVKRDGLVFVETPIPGTPAYDAGILAGDLILKIDGKATEKMPLRKVVDTIQGEPGTPVMLNILHEGAETPVDIQVVRAEIKIDSVMGDQRSKTNLKDWDFWIEPDSKIAYIRISTFTETTTAEITRVVDALQKNGMKGLVVDLRNNPGGLLRSAVEVASLFLPDGKPIVTTKGRGDVKEDSYTAHHVDPNMKEGTYYPLAILINRYSASASEIVAAALQDHLRAIIIGERSYGKGSVQNVIPMEGGASALKLTTASYWRPSGRNIHRFPDYTDKDEWGVKPNKGYEVELNDKERIQYFKWRQKRDIVRRAGQEAPKEPETDKEGEKGDKAEKPFTDRVLEKALEYIHEQLRKGQGNAAAPAPAVEEPVVVEAASLRLHYPLGDDRFRNVFQEA